MRFALSVAALAVFAFPVYSQQNDSVVVTATRFADDARRLPASVTVLAAGEIRNRPARTIPELLAAEVGITARDLFGNNAASTALDLRGIGANASQNVVILVDGRRVNDFDLSSPQWAAIPLSSIERIEIMRGTGGVLYGDGAISGVINIVTRSPLLQGTRVEAFGRTATYNTLETQLYGSHGGSAFGINGSVYGYSSDGYRANNRNEQSNHTLNLRWALGEGALDFRFGSDRQDLRLPGVRRVRPSTGLDEYANDRRGAQNPGDFSSRDGVRAGVAYEQKLGDAQLKVGFDLRKKDSRIRSPFQFQADDLARTSLTPRLRLPFQAAGMQHRLTLGIDVHAWKYASRRADTPENVDRPGNRVRARQRTVGWYALDTIDLTPSTLATVGLRGERARYQLSDSADPTAPACAFGCNVAPAANPRQSQHAWELGLKHTLDTSWSVFGRANRAFRLVNIDEIYEAFENPPGSFVFAQRFDVLRPQVSRTLEAGTEWRSGPRSVRAALFQTGMTDEIHLNPVTLDNRNLPPSRRRGLELEARTPLVAGVQLTAAYAQTRGRILDGTQGTISLAGKTVPLVPRHKVNVGLLWDVGSRTTLSAAYSALSRQFMDNDEGNVFGRVIPGYATLDLKLSHDWRGARFALAVNNAFDRKYFAYAVASASTDQANLYPLPGRVIGVSAEIKME